ncbi:hypothetical protein J7L13_01855 [bacterium]|nr:hypothetical protein [bacterium]
MPLIPKEISGEIAEEEPEVYEELQELGSNIYKYFDTESLHKLMEMLEERGYKEEAKNIEDWFYTSEEYWANRYWLETGEVIMYDPDVKRWRSMETGRFVKDPYRYLWKEEG